MQSKKTPQLNLAIKIAAEHHLGHFCWNGEPYFMHVMRVMNAVDTPLLKAVAVLHDVIEDNPHLTESDLRSFGMDMTPVHLVGVLTRQDSETYESYIERVAGNPAVIPIKIADLEDNMDLARIPFELQNHHLERLQTYHRAWRRLNDALALQSD